MVGHLHAEHEVSDKVSLGQQEYHICSGEPGDTLHPRVPPASEGKCLEVRQSRQGLGEQVTYPEKMLNSKFHHEKYTFHSNFAGMNSGRPQEIIS